MTRLARAQRSLVQESWERNLRRSMRVWEAIGQLQAQVKVLTWRLDQQEARGERLIEQLARAAARIDLADERLKPSGRPRIPSRKGKSRRSRTA